MLLWRRALAVSLATALLFLAAGAFVRASCTPGIPPAVDPGTPMFTGPADPVPPEPAPLTPGKSRLQAIYDADVAAGAGRSGSTACSSGRS